MDTPFVAIHNAKLFKVYAAKDGYEVLVIEHARSRISLDGESVWSGERSCRDVGQFGYVTPMLSRELKRRVHFFHKYIDQSLRRVPEMDQLELGMVGWRCDKHPHGFWAPIGIIPGTDGDFVPDETEEVTLQVPPEFVRECRRLCTTPEDLLRSFVGDVVGIQNSDRCPRADQYSSNGSDERDLAQAWLERAHGMDALDVDELEALENKRKERQDVIDEFEDILDVLECGGLNADELLNDLSALITKTGSQ